MFRSSLTRAAALMHGLVLAAGPALGSTPADYAFQRVMGDFDRLAERLGEIRRDTNEQVVRQLKGPDGELVDTKEVLKPITKADADLAALRAQFEGFYEQYQTGAFNARGTLMHCSNHGQNALNIVWKAERAMTAQAIRVIAGRQRYQSELLELDYRSAYNRLMIRLEDASYESRQREIAALQDEFAAREEQLFAQILRDYEVVTRELADDRRELAGMAWKLEDFFDRLELPDLAKSCRAFVYRAFAYRLKGRSPELLRELFGYRQNLESDLDFFVLFPNSGGRLILRPRLHDPDQSSHWMGAVFHAEPVESLRQFDRGMPPLNFDGTLLEQHILLLEERLKTYRQTKKKLATQMLRLEEMNRKLDDTESFEGLVRLGERLRAFPPDVIDWNDAVARHDGARARLADAEKELARAEAELAEATTGLFVDRRSGRKTDPGAPGALALEEARVLFNEQIASWQRQADDASLPDDQRRAAQSMASGVRERLKRVEAVLEEAAAQPEQRVTAARAKRRLAREWLAENPAVPDTKLLQRWVELTRQWEEANPACRAAGVQAPPWPRAWRDLEHRALDEHAECLVEVDRALRAQQRNMQLRLQDLYFETVRLDARLAPLAASIARLKVSATNEVDAAIKSLGIGSDDAFFTELKSLQTGLAESEKFFSAFDDRTKALEWSLRGVFAQRDAAKIPQEMRQHLGVVKSTLGKLNMAAESAMQINEVLEKGDSSETALDALSTLLDLAGTAAGKVPVAGPALQPFIKVYAQSTAACAKAARRIQGKVIARDLDVMMQGRDAPERRFYTRDQVAQRLTLRNEDVISRATTMVQVRRLLALINETP